MGYNRMIILGQAQINIVLSILLFILLVHAYLNMNRKKTINILFMLIMLLTLSALILETFSVILSNSNLKEFMVLNKLVNIFGFILAPSILYIGYLFSREWASTYQNEKIKVNYILILPLLINALGALSSYNFNVLFYITSNNIYERGRLFFVLPCVSGIYIVYNLYFIYKHRKKFTYEECALFSSFYIVPAIFSIVQLIHPSDLTIWNSTAIILVITYIFILNGQSNCDGLTGLENRLSYEHYVQNINDKMKNKLFFIYMDLDEFKKINDQCGHFAGDEVIKKFASLLIESFVLRKKKLIRVGGDEFLVLLEEESREQVDFCLQKLIQNVKEYNDRAEKPYKLKFSYGCVLYTDDCESIYELYQKADRLMYEQKQNKKLLKKNLSRDSS